jgi:hypothetical protein
LNDDERKRVVEAETKPEGWFWSDNDHVIVLREQPETACYFNDDGALVIRQRHWPDEDSVVVIGEESIFKFLDRLTEMCGIPSVGKP